MSASNIREQWDRLRAAYDAANAAADGASLACEIALPELRDSIVDESDQANHVEYVAWQAVMKAPAPDLPAVHWKLIEIFGNQGRERIEGGLADEWLFDLTDVILSDVARLNGGEA